MDELLKELANLLHLLFEINMPFIRLLQTSRFLHSLQLLHRLS